MNSQEKVIINNWWIRIICFYTVVVVWCVRDKNKKRMTAGEADTTEKNLENVLTNRRQTIRKFHTSAFHTSRRRQVKEDGHQVSKTLVLNFLIVRLLLVSTFYKFFPVVLETVKLGRSKLRTSRYRPKLFPCPCIVLTSSGLNRRTEDGRQHWSSSRPQMN